MSIDTDTDLAGDLRAALAESARWEAVARMHAARAEDLRAAVRTAAHGVYGLCDIAWRSATRAKIQGVGLAMTAAMVADLDRVWARSASPETDSWA